MKLRSLLCSSASTLDPATADDDLKTIIALAAERNRAHGVTGALFITGDRFTHVIEGTPEAVETVFKIVSAAKAHRDIVILQDDEISERRFGAWDMAYAGPSVFVERQVSQALAQALKGRSPDVRKLLTLMQAFSRAS